MSLLTGHMSNECIEIICIWMKNSFEVGNIFTQCIKAYLFISTIFWDNIQHMYH